MLCVHCFAEASIKVTGNHPEAVVSSKEAVDVLMADGHRCKTARRNMAKGTPGWSKACALNKHLDVRREVQQAEALFARGPYHSSGYQDIPSTSIIGTAMYRPTFKSRPWHHMPVCAEALAAAMSPPVPQPVAACALWPATAVRPVLPAAPVLVD